MTRALCVWWLQGDELAAAACGLTTGYVHNPASAGLPACSSPTSLLDNALLAACFSESSSSSSGSGSASSSASNSHKASSNSGSSRSSNHDDISLPSFGTAGMSAWDVDSVEHHLLQLLQLPGLEANSSSHTGHHQLQQQQQQTGQLCSASLQRQLQHSELQVRHLQLFVIFNVRWCASCSFMP